MKLIYPKVELLTQEPGLVGMYKHIENVARVCYLSNNKITDDSYKKMISMLTAKEHLSPLEHSTVYLKLSYKNRIYRNTFIDNPYSLTYVNNELYVATNYRVLYEWDMLLDLLNDAIEYKDIINPPEDFKRYTVKLTCSIGIAREFCRHRAFSFMQESTRFVDHNNINKVGNHIAFIYPTWLSDLPEVTLNSHEEIRDFIDLNYNGSRQLLDHFLACEKAYKNLRGWKLSPQQARDVLPLATKTTLVMTGFKHQWDKFFKDRISKAAHPDALYLANEIKRLIYGV